MARSMSGLNGTLSQALHWNYSPGRIDHKPWPWRVRLTLDHQIFAHANRAAIGIANGLEAFRRVTPSISNLQELS